MKKVVFFSTVFCKSDFPGLSPVITSLTGLFDKWSSSNYLFWLTKSFIIEHQTMSLGLFCTLLPSPTYSAQFPVIINFLTILQIYHHHHLSSLMLLYFDASAQSRIPFLPRPNLRSPSVPSKPHFQMTSLLKKAFHSSWGELVSLCRASVFPQSFNMCHLRCRILSVWLPRG